MVGSQTAPIVSVAPTSAVFTLPAGAGTAPVVFSAGSLSSAPVSYAYGAPSLAAVFPATLKTTGGAVQISGQNFGPSGTSIVVTIGGQPCAISSATHTSLSCTVGTLPVGAQPLRVTVAGQDAGTLTVQVVSG